MTAVLAFRASASHALTRIEAAREHLMNAGQPEKHSQLQCVVTIIGELRADLDLSAGGAIAANLDDLYDYMCRRLAVAGVQNRIAALNEVSHLLDALHSAWMFMPVEVRTAARNPQRM
jgi:flagellar secretion chaperone FliS